MIRTTALLAAMSFGATLAGATAANAAAAGVEWGPCPEKPQSTEIVCATVTVPVDWSRPAAGTITVAIARRAADNPIGTLFYLPGGPGDSGVQRLLNSNPMPVEIASRFDVVSFDPRGTNRSNPVVCDADLVRNPPDANPEGGATFAALRTYARALGASCREHTGPLLDHVDSVSVARDIDAIRAALGERTMSLYGRSYGTLAGAMYAERFPHRVRALLLDSVFDHSLSPARFLETEARTGEDSFREFAKWCDSTDECALHGRDVAGVYDDLYKRSLAGELVDPSSGRSVRPMDLVFRTLQHFYAPRWPRAATDFRALADGTPAPTASADAAEVAPFPLAAFCADHRMPIRSQGEWMSLWERQKRAAPTLRMHFAWLPVSLCAAWPAQTNNPQHRLNIEHTPVLVLNSRHDPATGVEWARNVANQIDHGRLLIYDGWGHGVIDRTACTRTASARYLIDLHLPTPSMTCPASG